MRLRRTARRSEVEQVGEVVDRDTGADPATGVATIDLLAVLGRLKPDDRALPVLRYLASHRPGRRGGDAIAHLRRAHHGRGQSETTIQTIHLAVVREPAERETSTEASQVTDPAVPPDRAEGAAFIEVASAAGRMATIDIPAGQPITMSMVLDEFAG